MNLLLLQEPGRNKENFFPGGIFIWSQIIQVISTSKYPQKKKRVFHVKIENIPVIRSSSKYKS